VDQDRNDEVRSKVQGEDLVRHLERYGVKSEARVLHSGGSDASAVFRDVTRELSVDLLVLGAYSRPRFSELLFGGVTQWALRDSHIPVLMSH
jgi:nucleotide-binding universal stress UspA family protein